MSHDFDSSDDEEPRVDSGEGEVRKLETEPLKIDWVRLSDSDDRKIAFSALPGCRFKNTWRSLQVDIGYLKSAGITDVFVLCTRGELHKYRVPNLLEEYHAAGVKVHHFPFLDGHTPDLQTLSNILCELQKCLEGEKSPLIHCFGGLGRTCLVGACFVMWRDQSISSAEAIERMKGIRGSAAIQSVKQYNFINEFREKFLPFQSAADSLPRSISR